MQKLTGMSFGLIGTKEIQEKFKQHLLTLGVNEVDIINLCTMNLVVTKGLQRLKHELCKLQQYQWIVFTSQNAIKLFFDTMHQHAIDGNELSHIQFAVVGNGTKQALLRYGYLADFMPTKYTSADLALELAQIVPKNHRLLIPRASRGSEELGAILNKNKIDFLELPIYDVVGTLTNQIENLSRVHYLVFSSASGVTSFFHGLEHRKLTLPPEIKIACIGKVTANELQHYKKEADICSNVHDVDGLVASILNCI